MGGQDLLSQLLEASKVKIAVAPAPGLAPQSAMCGVGILVAQVGGCCSSRCGGVARDGGWEAMRLPPACAARLVAARLTRRGVIPVDSPRRAGRRS